MALTSEITFKVTGTYTAAKDLSTVTDPLALSKSIPLASGTGANQADLLFHDQRTIAASSNDDLDLAGSLSDSFGNTLTFVKVKTIYVFAATANTNSVVVGGAASNQFVAWVGDATDKVNILPGGAFMITAPSAAGYAVAAGSTDVLRVANSSAGTTVTYDITIIGTSA